MVTLRTSRYEVCGPKRLIIIRRHHSVHRRTVYGWIVYARNADDESMREEDLSFSRVSRSSFSLVARFLFLRRRETKKKEERRRRRCSSFIHPRDKYRHRLILTYVLKSCLFVLHFFFFFGFQNLHAREREREG
jgi:hypothetical protein